MEKRLAFFLHFQEPAIEYVEIVCSHSVTLPVYVSKHSKSISEPSV